MLKRVVSFIQHGIGPFTTLYQQHSWDFKKIKLQHSDLSTHLGPVHPGTLSDRMHRIDATMDMDKGQNCFTSGNWTQADPNLLGIGPKLVRAAASKAERIDVDVTSYGDIYITGSAMHFLWRLSRL